MVKRLTAMGVKFREVKVPPMHKRGQVLVTILFKKPWYKRPGDLMHAIYFVPVHNQDIRHIRGDDVARRFYAALTITEKIGWMPEAIEVEVIPGSVIKAPGRRLLGAIRRCQRLGRDEYLSQSDIIAMYNKPHRKIVEIIEWPTVVCDPGMTFLPPKDSLKYTIETHSESKSGNKDA